MLLLAFHTSHDGLATRNDGGSRGTNVIDDKKMLALQGALGRGWAGSVFGLWTRGCPFENLAHVVESLPAVLVGLAFCKGVAPDDVGIDGEMSQLGDTLGYFFTLVVSSLLQTIGGEWNRNDAIDILEEADSHSFLCQESPHVEGNFRAMRIFQLVKDVAGESVPLVIKESACFLYGNLMPKHLGHLILVGILPSVCPWKVQVASHANRFLLAGKAVAANGTEAGKQQVDDFR